jgi:hypothetical protein
MTAPLRLGVVGLSEGNGHPYSWSAIFNGYDKEVMEECGFPVIPRYLERQSFPADAIRDATVTHVWTQDAALSSHVARASRIPHVSSRFDDMLGAVDAILLARDDAETHFEFVAPVLDAGLPIYIDKPIALSQAELERLYERQQYPGQIFTCSALRYAAELRLDEEARTGVGNIRVLHAVTPKDWDRYAVHVIEPALAILGEQGRITEAQASAMDCGGAALAVRWESGVRAHFVATGGGVSCPLSLRVMGDRGWRDLHFCDTFAAFRAALDDFVHGVRARDVRADPGFVKRVVNLIEWGRAA